MQIFDGSHAAAFVEWMFHDQLKEVRQSILLSLTDLMDDAAGPSGFIGMRAELSPSDYLVTYAMLYPGQMAILTGPRYVSDRDQQDANRFIRQASELCMTLAHLATERWPIEILQTTLQHDAEFETQSLIGAGFQFLATLHQLMLLFPNSIESSQACQAANWERVEQHHLPLLHQWLDATYDATLDCPELTALRDTAHVVEGYWQLGNGSSVRRALPDAVALPQWWMLREQGAAPNTAIQAAFLLTPIHPGTWELTYFGVAQPFRRRGLGQQTLKFAIEKLEQLNARQLITYVDIRNSPAIAMYDKLGFRVAGHWNAFHWPMK